MVTKNELQIYKYTSAKGKAEIDETEHSEVMNEEVCLTLDVHECHVWTDIRKDYSW